jgi:hypothetical protein
LQVVYLEEEVDKGATNRRSKSVTGCMQQVRLAA